MKEATGELNMTVITVLVIAALGIIGTTVVIPAIRGGMDRNAKCAAAVCTGSCTNGTQKCTYYNTESNNSNTTGQVIDCSCK